MNKNKEKDRDIIKNGGGGGAEMGGKEAGRDVSMREREMVRWVSRAWCTTKKHKKKEEK